MEIFKLFGSIFIDNEEAEKSIAKTEESGASFGEKMGGFFGKVGKTAAVMGTAVVGAATGIAAGLGKMVMGAAETADEIDKLSERTGIGAEELQRWKYALGQSGGDVAKLEVGMKKLSGVMDAAANGNEKSIAALESLGVSMDDLKNKSQEDIFAMVTAGLADMEEGAARNVLGNDLLGKAYTDMLPLLNAGSDGMNELKNRADELGLVMSGDAVAAGVGFGDSLQDVKDSLGAVGTQIAAKLMPFFQTMVDKVLAFMPKIHEMIEKILPSLQSAAEKLLPPLLDLAEKLLPLVMQMLEVLIPVIVNIAEAILPLIIGAVELFSKALSFVFEVVLPKAKDIFSTVFDSIGKKVSGIFEDLEPVFEAFQKYLGGLISFVTGVFSRDWKKAWNGVKDIFGGIMDGLKALFKMPLNFIIDGVNSFISGINSLKIPDWVPGVGGYSFNLPNIPRLAVGLDYVPYDNFPAFLHEGETVLTKAEAEDRRRGQDSGKTVMYTMHFNNVKEKDTAFRVRRAVQQAERLQLV